MSAEKSWKSTTSARAGLSGLPLFIAFAAVSLLLFAPMLGGWFQEDDYDILYRVSAHGPFGIWTFGPTNFFRPLISLLFWGQYRAWGLNPVPYRILNDLLHAGVATAVSLILFELLDRRFRSVAVAAGALFLVAPSHVEAVNWIAARTDLCGALFGLLSLLAFLRWAKSGGRLVLAASLLLFAAGLFSKESAVLVPLIAWVLTWKRTDRRLGLAMAGFGLVFATYAAVRLTLMGPALQGNLHRAGGLKLIGATAAQVARTFLPGLPFGDPNLNNADAVRTASGLAYLGIGAGLLLAVLLLARRTRQAPVNRLLLSYALALLPAAGLSLRLFRSQGERFVYLPSAFAFMLLAIALSSLFVKKRQLMTAVATVGVAFVTLVQWQNLYWREGAELSREVQESFVQDVVAKTPSDQIALFNVPTGVQGAYGVAYVFDSVAPLLVRGRHPAVSVLSMVRTKSLQHSVGLSQFGPRLEFSTGSPETVFSVEDTFTGAPADPGSLRRQGYVSFKPRQLDFDAGKLPQACQAFFWNGNRFERLEIPPPAKPN